MLAQPSDDVPGAHAFSADFAQHLAELDKSGPAFPGMSLARA